MLKESIELCELGGGQQTVLPRFSTLLSQPRKALLCSWIGQPSSPKGYATGLEYKIL